MIDEWPNDEEMSDLCGCGHMLGQHEYGDERSPCDICKCLDFHDPCSCPYRTCKHDTNIP